MDFPTLALVFVSALIDSINPCLIGVLVLLLSIILGLGKSTNQLILLGCTYITAVFVTYLSTGLVLTFLLSAIPLAIGQYLSIAIGLLVVIAGLLEIKDYFWYGKGISIHLSHNFVKKVQHYSANATLIGIAILGVIVTVIEIPCTGAPYLAIVTILHSSFSINSFWMLILYNIIFILPLAIILALAASGVTLSHIHKWKESSKAKVRLAIGILLIILGWILILIANGALNFN
ncbi:MAG: GAP family protein [Candidatus Woesebacteria bacterium]